MGCPSSRICFCSFSIYILLLCKLTSNDDSQNYIVAWWKTKSYKPWNLCKLFKYFMIIWCCILYKTATNIMYLITETVNWGFKSSWGFQIKFKSIKLFGMYCSKTRNYCCNRHNIVVWYWTLTLFLWYLFHFVYFNCSICIINRYIIS